MKNVLAPINKPLTPFIMLLSLVILTTIIVLHLRGITNPPEPPAPARDAVSTRMVLSPFTDLPAFRTAKWDRKFDQEIKVPDFDRNLALAYAEIDRGDLAAAEDRLRTLYVFYPDSTRLLAMLGNVLFSLGRYTDSEFFYRQRAALNPDNPSVYNDLGAVLARQLKFPEAIQNEERAMTLDPGSHLAAYNLASLYAVTGDRVKAVEFLKKAYEQMGEPLLPLLKGSQFDSLRDIPEFKLLFQQSPVLYGKESPSK